MHLFAAGDADLGQLDGLGRHLADIVEMYRLGAVFHQVKDVVHARHQMMNVIPVDGCDEGLAQCLDGVVGDLVASFLQRFNVEGAPFQIIKVRHQRQQLLAGQNGLISQINKQLEKTPFKRHQSSEHTHSPFAVSAF